MSLNLHQNGTLIHYNNVLTQTILYEKILNFFSFCGKKILKMLTTSKLCKFYTCLQKMGIFSIYENE